MRSFHIFFVVGSEQAVDQTVYFRVSLDTILWRHCNAMQFDPADR